MNELRRQAEALRGAGYSYNMITEKLGISSSTMSYWFKDKPFTPNKEVLKRIQYGPIKSGALKHQKKLEAIKQARQAGKREIGLLSKRDLLMLGLGIYIGEGAKTIEAVRISNSDPVVIRTGVRWLKKICNLNDENITIRLHLYPDSNEAEAKDYWREVTGLPPGNFRKTIVDTRENKKLSNRSKLPYGTAHISVVANGNPEKGVMLYRKIESWRMAAVENL
jgi:hypothetical protein